MPTVIGIIFFASSVYCFFYRPKNLLGLLIVSTVFEGASAINILDRGIQPYYLVASFIIARALLNWMMGVSSGRHVPHGRWLLLFGSIAVVSAFVLPFVFSGTPIMDSKIGIDDGFWIHPPLRFGINNVVQAVFVAFQVATVYAVTSLTFSGIATRRAYLFAFGLEVLFVVAESASQLLGFDFPLSLVLSNPGYAVWDMALSAHGIRNPGTFTEPSVAGAFLVMYSIGFLVEYLAGRGKAFRVFAGLITSGLIASSSSLVVLVLAPFALAVRYSPLCLPWRIDLDRVKRLAAVLALLLAPLAAGLLFSASYREDLASLTVSKGDTGSFVHRTASDLFALDLLVKTHGLGVGLGSNRSSSFISNLLSAVGVAGTLSFGIFYYKLFVHLPNRCEWLRWAGFGLLLNMCFGIPDVTMPILWIPILLAVMYRAEEQRNTSLARPAGWSELISV